MDVSNVRELRNSMSNISKKTMLRNVVWQNDSNDDNNYYFLRIWIISNLLTTDIVTKLINKVSNAQKYYVSYER